MKKNYFLLIMLLMTGGFYYLSALEMHDDKTSNDIVIAPLNLELVHFYDTELFRWVRIGFGNVTLMYQNQPVLGGLFGRRINNTARMAFSLL